MSSESPKSHPRTCNHRIAAPVLAGLLLVAANGCAALQRPEVESWLDRVDLPICHKKKVGLPSATMTDYYPTNLVGERAPRTLVSIYDTNGDGQDDCMTYTSYTIPIHNGGLFEGVGQMESVSYGVTIVGPGKNHEKMWHYEVIMDKGGGVRVHIIATAFDDDLDGDADRWVTYTEGSEILGADEETIHEEGISPQEWLDGLEMDIIDYWENQIPDEFFKKEEEWPGNSDA